MNQELRQGCEGVSPTGCAAPQDVRVCQMVDKSRRHFMKLNLLGLISAPAVGLLVSDIAYAGRSGRTPHDDATPILDPNDPQAVALSYSSESRKAHQMCSNCQLYTGTEGEDSGPCAIFSYRVAPTGKQLVVDASGWCRAWGPRQEV